MAVLLQYEDSQGKYLYMVINTNIASWLTYVRCTSYYDFRHHHLSNMLLGHLLTHSGLTHLEVPLMVSPSFFHLLGCSFFQHFTCYYVTKHNSVHNRATFNVVMTHQFPWPRKPQFLTAESVTHTGEHITGIW